MNDFNALAAAKAAIYVSKRPILNLNKSSDWYGKTLIKAANYNTHTWIALCVLRNSVWMDRVDKFTKFKGMWRADAHNHLMSWHKKKFVGSFTLASKSSLFRFDTYNVGLDKGSLAFILKTLNHVKDIIYKHAWGSS